MSTFSAQKILSTVLFTIATGLIAQAADAQEVEYRLTVSNYWNQEHHQSWAQSFATVDKPHFSHLGGGTHNSDLVVWELGQLSSEGMIKMQETGWIDEPGSRRDLRNEFDAYLADGSAGSFINYPRPDPWFPAGQSIDEFFTIQESHPLVTLVSMLGPSPDWFIGVSGLNLRDGNLWKQHVEVDLYPYDGGSEGGDDRFSLNGPRQNPQLPIQLLEDTANAALLGNIPIGKFTFELMTPQSILGDFNGNGIANFGDLSGAVLALTDAAQFATVYPGVDRLGVCDANADSACNFGDLGDLASIYQSGSSSGASVPEPTTLLLILVAGIGVSCFRHER